MMVVMKAIMHKCLFGGNVAGVLKKLSGDDQRDVRKTKVDRSAVLPNICFEFISPTLLYGVRECMRVT